MSDTIRTFPLGARVHFPAKVGGKNIKRTAFVIKISAKNKAHPYTVETVDGEKYTPSAASLTTSRGRRPAKFAKIGKGK